MSHFTISLSQIINKKESSGLVVKMSTSWLRNRGFKHYMGIMAMTPDKTSTGWQADSRVIHLSCDSLLDDQEQSL